MYAVYNLNTPYDSVIKLSDRRVWVSLFFTRKIASPLRRNPTQRAG